MATCIVEHVSTAYDANVPPGKRVPFSWKAIPIAPVHIQSPLFLAFAPGTIDHSILFRITVALDVREEKLIEAFLPSTGLVAGIFDIRYAPVFQVFQITLDKNIASQVMQEGIGLRMVQGSEPLWIFAEQPAPEQFMPHLLLPSAEADPFKAFGNTMLSMASVQQFGWEEGCVLDGLIDLGNALHGSGALAIARKHLDHYFQPDGTLIYEDPYGRPADGIVKSIETTLPFAALAAVFPDHPAIELAVNCWMVRRGNDGSIQDSSFVSAEGAYTIAYPMAAIAQVKKRPDLAEMALRQLLIRKERLIDGDNLFLRSNAQRVKTFRNWGRAFAWYMLGLVRTGIVLKEQFVNSELQNELCRIAKVTVLHHSNGLWSCFVDDKSSGIDTSATAGIAAALALGSLHGLLPRHFMAIARASLESLKCYLTPDGFLTGVAQSNRGGEKLQRSGYRVISQMAMGLMAQLHAAVMSEQPIDSTAKSALGIVKASAK